ncbi:MAG: NAD(P)/FAD-dependent oxidoreductase, partial [Kiritimatiellaeota bacterium]|nr:NAD(P)/FAD-dependent oxidoreductase [Kiritimatiellota bacterium]
EEPGGILRQCIHPGFGLEIFKEELTGPEYAQRYIDEARALGIRIQCNTMVLDIAADKTVTCSGGPAVRRALHSNAATHNQAAHSTAATQFHPKAIVLAMGCRERPRGALMIPGTRPAGIYTAGTAQRLVNLEGWMPGRRVVILGSGDIGLIMARRMVFEGAEVLACVELMPFSAGLARNIAQCLDDFNIPLILESTVTQIHGRDRLEGVTIAQIKNGKPVAGSERYLECDTLLLSVGLLPENELSRGAGVSISDATGGPVVDDSLETDVPGIFACGNVLHVHDLVDFVSIEAAAAGEAAARFIKCETTPPFGHPSKGGELLVVDGAGVRGVVPQIVEARKFVPGEKIAFSFRPTGVFRNAAIVAELDGVEVFRKKALIFTPGEMQRILIPAEKLNGKELKLIIDN